MIILLEKKIVYYLVRVQKYVDKLLLIGSGSLIKGKLAFPINISMLSY